MFVHNRPQKALSCWELSTGTIRVKTCWRNDLPRQVLYGQARGLGHNTFPQFHFKPPQSDNIPLHGRTWKAIAKRPLSWKLLGAASSPVRWTSCTIFFSQEDYDYLRAQRISGMWMSSKVCSIQRVCDLSDCYPVMMNKCVGVSQ